MKKLLVVGAVCLVGLSSCRSVPCPAYTKLNVVKSPASQMVKATTAIEKIEFNRFHAFSGYERTGSGRFFYFWLTINCVAAHEFLNCLG